MASITNSYSEINDSPDKWDSMTKMITSKQGFSTLLIKSRLKDTESNQKFPFIYVKRNEYLRGILENQARRDKRLRKKGS